MLARVLFSISLASLLLLALILSVSTPSSAGPLGILGVFVLAYLVFLGFFTFLIYGASRMLGKLILAKSGSPRSREVSLQKAYYYSSVIALIPVMLVGLQSVGGVGVYEFFLVILFAFIGVIYVSKRFI